MAGEITIQGTQELRKALANAGREATKALANAMWWEMTEIIEAAKLNIPVDTGNLRASGTVLPPTIQGTYIEVEGGFGGSAASYAIWVHEGRSPGGKMPPREPIEAWARRHGIPEEAVFNIQRAIAARGIPATKFLERAMLEAAPGMERRLAQSIKEQTR